MAGTVRTVSTHGIKSHGPGQIFISKHNQAIAVQVLFFKNQYFEIHPMLQSIRPGDPFSKFYYKFPAQYMNGATVDRETIDAADLGDLSLFFLTNSGWVQVTDGYSIAGIRAISVIKAQSRHEGEWLDSIKGLGSWRTRM
jgi:hypothetical protein